MDVVGRRHERDAIARAAAAAVGGTTSVVLVRGDPGIGKTALLHVLRRQAAADGWFVLDGSVTEPERSLSWGSLAGVLRQAQGEHLDALPEAQRRAVLGASGRGEADLLDPLTVASGMADLLSAMAAERPVLLLLDDIHWLDETSASAFSFLLRNITTSALLVAIGTRPTGATIDVERLVPPERRTVVELDGLSLSASRELLVRRLQLELNRIDLLRLHEASGGNPLHVLESGRLIVKGVPLQEALAPRSATELLAAAASRLDPTWREVLCTTALLARADIPTLVTLYGEAAVVAGLSGGERAGLLTISGDVVALTHPLVATALLDHLSTLELRALHRRCAEVTADPVARGVHLAAAHHGADEAAATQLEHAAEQAVARGAQTLAARLARTAAELTPEGDAQARTRRLLQTADLEWGAGAHDAARRLALDLLDRLNAEQRLLALRIIAISTISLDGPVASLPEIERWAAECPAESTELIDALLALSRMRLFATQLPGAATAASDAAAIAGRIGDEARSVKATIAQAVARMIAAEAVDIDELLDLVAGYAGPTMAPSPRAMVGELCSFADRHEDAIRLQLEEVADASRCGALVAELNAHSQLISLYERTGRWALAEQHGESSLAIAQSIGNPTKAGQLASELATIDEARGLHRLADERIATMVPIDELVSLNLLDAHARLGRIAVLRGEWETAVEHLSRARHEALAFGMLEPGCIGYHFDLMEALVRTRRLDDAREVAAELRSAAERSGRPRARAEAERAEGLCAGAAGRADEALALLERAADGFTALSMPFEEARTRLHAGRVARRANQRARARTHLAAALELFRAVGAEPLAARTAADLQRSTGQAASAGGPALTATEEQIAALVAEGRTNDEVAATLFISRRTVESNLTRIYRKLGVTSRTALAVKLQSLSAD